MYRKLHNCLTKHTYAAVSLCLSISDFFLFVSDQDVVCSWEVSLYRTCARFPQIMDGCEHVMGDVSAGRELFFVAHEWTAIISGWRM
jgi:hypothetical protein